MSIDGKIALKNGKSQWITSPYSRQDVQKFRAKSSAILSTSSTILTDNSLLNVRIDEFNKKLLSYFPINIFKQPIRIIIDSQNRINVQHKIIHTKGQIWLARKKHDQKKWPKNVVQLIFPTSENNIDMLSLLIFLGQKQLNNIWIEAGSTLSGFLLNTGLIDEVILYMSPKILGHKAKSLCILHEILELSNCLKFKFKKIDSIGPDVRLILQPYKKKIIQK